MLLENVKFWFQEVKDEKNLITLNQEYEDIKNQKTALEEEINNKDNTITRLTEEVENLKK